MIKINYQYTFISSNLEYMLAKRQFINVMVL